MIGKLLKVWGEFVDSPPPYMLSYIWQQHCRIVAFSRCFVIKRRMASLKVVGAYILPNSASSLSDVAVLRQISLLVFETAEPSFNHDVISQAAFAIHALPDSVILYKVNVALTGKLTSLI